jgi:hypothetical protein
MKNTSPTAILLNVGHLMDHWVLAAFACSQFKPAHHDDHLLRRHGCRAC